MYISKLKIKNFRIFCDNEIEFNEKLNVIIGPNNSGKSTLISSLRILFDKTKRNRLNINDFNKNIDFTQFKENPPKITITAIITQSDNEKSISKEIIPIATWLTKISDKYEAKLTYEFFLPDKYGKEYIKKFEAYNIKNNVDYWNFLEKEIIQKYIYKYYVGNEKHENTVDWDDLAKFDFQFLSAIRDVEKDLSNGKKSLLKEVLDFFTDYEIKENETLDDDEKVNRIKKKSKEFNEQSKILFDLLDDRLKEGKTEILQYIYNTGAEIDQIIPNFSGKLSEKDLYEHISLIIDNEKDIELPVELNGLGYNNLLYISLILAKIQKNSSIKYLGDNAKSYTILSIEEPEAHIHPNMQYKFLKFLKENQEEKTNQIFITSHSPNITSSVELDNLIILDKINGKIKTYYPYKTFLDDEKSKKYVERFLDVTKSDMFFAKKLIFVEGLAEQILIPIFFKNNMDLVDYHISIININGNNFDPFLKMFNTKTGGIDKKIVCITDKDCQKKERKKNSRWNQCYSYEMYLDDNYEYKNNSDNILKLKNSENINIITQDNSHTFEYDIILTNPDCKGLINNIIQNKEEIKNMMDIYKKNPENYEEIFEKLKSNNKNEIKKNIILNNKLSEKEKSKHLIATRYNESLSKKGRYAQELGIDLLDNNFEIKIPNYITEAVSWIKK